MKHFSVGMIGDLYKVYKVYINHNGGMKSAFCWPWIIPCWSAERCYVVERRISAKQMNYCKLVWNW